jgi:hypothetical protein
MRFEWLISFAVASVSLGAAPTKLGPPKFECTDAEGTSYKVWIAEGPKRMSVTEKGKTRDIALSGANLFRPDGDGKLPLRYSGWNPRGGDVFGLLDQSTEFSVQYVVDNGTSRALVSVFLDYRERPGLSCKVSGPPVAVVSAEREIPFAARYTQLFAEVADLRSRKGTLEPIAVARIEGAVRRLFNSPEMKTGRQAFLDACGPVLKDIDPRTTLQIGARLRGAVGDFWKKILEDIRYRYYSDASRYSSWIKEGARPGRPLHAPSVISGFNQFVASAGFKDKDIKAYFVTEITPTVKELAEADVPKVQAYLSREGMVFFDSLWTKLHNRKTLSDFPEVESVVREIANLLAAREFDARLVHRAITRAQKLLPPLGPEAKGLFLKSASPLLRGMSPRQKEDLMGWFEDPSEKAFLVEVVR